MSNITEDGKIQFADDVKEDEKQLENEITKILKAADGLIAALEKISPQIESGKIVNDEVFYKIAKPLCVTVENFLPQLLDHVDNLEYLQDDNAFVLKQKVAKIEDDLLPPLLSYLNKHEASKKG